jgi:hypothetical protein
MLTQRLRFTLHFLAELSNYSMCPDKKANCFEQLRSLLLRRTRVICHARLTA